MMPRKFICRIETGGYMDNSTPKVSIVYMMNGFLLFCFAFISVYSCLLFCANVNRMATLHSWWPLEKATLTSWSYSSKQAPTKILKPRYLFDYVLLILEGQSYSVFVCAYMLSWFVTLSTAGAGRQNSNEMGQTEGPLRSDCSPQGINLKCVLYIDAAARVDFEHSTMAMTNVVLWR